jgi:hypothetical protein
MGAPQLLSYTRPAMRALPRNLFAAILASGCVCAVALADPEAAPETKSQAKQEADAPEPQGPPTKSLDLDRLLHPSAIHLQPSGKTYSGRDQKAWQEEFKRARQEVSDLEGKVEAGQARLRSAATGEWNYTPAGGEVTDPEVLKLRSKLRRDRQSLEASRQRLRDLDVEASLAGVPEEWRKP